MTTTGCSALRWVARIPTGSLALRSQCPFPPLFIGGNIASYLATSDSYAPGYLNRLSSRVFCRLRSSGDGSTYRLEIGLLLAEARHQCRCPFSLSGCVSARSIGMTDSSGGLLLRRSALEFRPLCLCDSLWRSNSSLVTSSIFLTRASPRSRRAGSWRPARYHASIFEQRLLCPKTARRIVCLAPLSSR